MGLFRAPPRPEPTGSTPAPYLQGYLDAERHNTYATGNILKNFPPAPFIRDMPAHQAWVAGVGDRISDATARVRRERDWPKWKLI